jgi:octaprenyl-diphosphate synthase
MSGAALRSRPAVPPGQPWDLVGEELRQVEACLAAQVESPIGRIPEVGNHLLGAGGKRLRPLLAVLAGRACNAPLDMAVAVGCAAELIHTATLFHDDVVDGGEVRRGRPAARLAFGNGIAVLVGDFCFARALGLVAGTGSQPAIRAFAAAVTEMAEGEVAQLQGAGNPETTVEDYNRVVDRKTAALIAWCARAGGVLPEPLDSALERYGRLVGRAFQITDDLLDCTAEENTTGKSVGRDLREGKITLPVLLACQADPEVRTALRAALGLRGMSPEASASVLARVRAARGTDRARAAAESLAERAMAELTVLSPSPYRDALATLARLSVYREA